MRLRYHADEEKMMFEHRNKAGYRKSRRLFNICGAVLAGAILAGCSATYEKREASTGEIQLLQPKAEVPETDLLEVRISTFDPGKISEEDIKTERVSRKIRGAEGYFMASRLRDTMQRSGHWGPVRVVPKGQNDGEIAVKGEILESDGEILKLRVDVSDATGATWYSKEYSGVVNQEMYERSQRNGSDAFQFLYNQISNDVAIHRNTLAKSQVARVRQVAELKFAAEFAPEIYGGYLRKDNSANHKKRNDVLANLFSAITPRGGGKDKETYQVIRLPAENDPSFQRIQRIRARENLLIETLDQQYDGLAQSIQSAYTQWRTARLTEMNAIRHAEKLENERAGKAIVTGLLGTALIVAGSRSNSCAGCGTAATAAGAVVLAQAVQEAIQLSQTAGADRKLHQIALEELGQSLASEVSPVVLEVEGEVVELTGSAEEKFHKWRHIMKKLHDQEVGPMKKSSMHPEDDGAITG
ncbi:MAG TPA: hypothetical protein DEV64_08365 [Rhodospirillaceae bacterium]|nr:hypothetical protein [Rhodospirillaceae bacterium]|tara:strand:+ start:217 stop:1626 length:1410 start_codon:yes stop_codon:yes gene_type:complete